MRQYQKKIKEYQRLIREQYVQEASVQSLAARCEAVMAGQEDRHISYFEFLYEQSRYIEKRWWALQGALLLLLWCLLVNNGADENMERLMGSFAAVFAILIIPEIWKNRRYSSVAVELASYYSLRQICTARILLFAAVDMVMVTFFFLITLHTVPILAYRLAVHFLIPFLVSCCICFRMLCSRRQGMEYTAAVLCMVWSVVWLAVIANDAVYDRISEPVWIGLIALFFGYLVFCIRKSLVNCEILWEV